MVTALCGGLADITRRLLQLVERNEISLPLAAKAASAVTSASAAKLTISAFTAAFSTIATVMAKRSSTAGRYDHLAKRADPTRLSDRARRCVPAARDQAGLRGELVRLL